MLKKHSSLHHWINKIGAQKLADKLDINSCTVRTWRLGYVLPKAEQMLAIKKLSRGQLTIDIMVEEYFKSPLNKEKHRLKEGMKALKPISLRGKKR